MDLGSFFGPISGSDGSSVATVDSVDLEMVWNLCGRAKLGQHAAIGHSAIEHACSPGADVCAVWYRVAMLQLLCGRAALLAPWMRDGDLEKVVFRVAAAFPMERMQLSAVYHELPLDVQEFVKQIEAETEK